MVETVNIRPQKGGLVKSIKVCLWLILAWLAMSVNLSLADTSTGHSDPAYLQIQSAENAITIDGKLDETDWSRRFDYLVFRPGFLPGDIEYGVTSAISVSGDYKDTTTTLVKILHRGLDLYIAIKSDDHYVSKWGGSWEGDGLFMKIKNKSGVALEYKLYFNASGVNPDIVLEVPVGLVGSAEAKVFKPAATIVNDTTQIDSGYIAEMVIHLDMLGYTDPYDNVEVMMNIFDPDGQTGTSGEDWVVGSYYKTWWGSEWGSEFRTLHLADPVTKVAVKTATAITLDGKLDEIFWKGADYVDIGEGTNLSSGGYYQQWGQVNNTYTDKSVARVKFAHKGTDMYIGVESNDSSVCKWTQGWEADGLFLWMTFKGIIPDGAGRLEVKGMYFSEVQGASAVFETNGNCPTGAMEGKSFEPQGTVTHTETNGKDHGYSLEMIIHTDLFGYSDGDTVKLSAVIWDMDYSSADVFNADTLSDYRPLWWGSQWVDPSFEKYFMYRNVVLSNQTTDVDEGTTTQSVSAKTQLEQNYPNPFNPNTTIRFNLAQSSRVKIEIFDLAGRKVSTLVNKVQTAGRHEFEWNGQDDQGNEAAAGMYLYRLTTPNYTESRKMILMK